MDPEARGGCDIDLSPERNRPGAAPFSYLLLSQFVTGKNGGSKIKSEEHGEEKESEQKQRRGF